VLERCQYLCDRVGEAGQLESLLRGQMVFYLSVDLARARDLGERHLALVRRLGRSSIYSHAMLAHILRSMGHFEEALARADAGLAVYDPAEDNPRIRGQLVDGRVGCLSDAAAALWCLGFPDQGWARVREMLDHARRLESPFSLSWALLNASRYLRISRDEAAGGAWLEEGVGIAREYGFRWLLGWGAIESGWRLVRGGSVDEGLALFREGLDLLQAQGTRVGQSINLSFLAEAYGHAGQAPRGLDVLADALGFVERVGERHFESGLHRVRGELLAALGRDAAGEASFRRALQVAREQNAKSLELRAALSLARLWQRRGRIQEARELLAEIHAWFTEGFDRPDVTDARQLLDELSPSAQRPATSPHD
jgi:tetratricopeptide (TPR) repeat protein